MCACASVWAPCVSEPLFRSGVWIISVRRCVRVRERALKAPAFKVRNTIAAESVPQGACHQTFLLVSGSLFFLCKDGEAKIAK